MFLVTGTKSVFVPLHNGHTFFYNGQTFINDRPIKKGFQDNLELDNLAPKVKGGQVRTESLKTGNLARRQFDTKKMGSIY